MYSLMPPKKKVMELSNTRLEGISKASRRHLEGISKASRRLAKAWGRESLFVKDFLVLPIDDAHPKLA